MWPLCSNPPKASNSLTVKDRVLAVAIRSLPPPRLPTRRTLCLFSPLWLCCGRTGLLAVLWTLFLPQDLCTSHAFYHPPRFLQGSLPTSFRSLLVHLMQHLPAFILKLQTLASTLHISLSALFFSIMLITQQQTTFIWFLSVSPHKQRGLFSVLFINICSVPQLVPGTQLVLQKYLLKKVKANCIKVRTRTSGSGSWESDRHQNVSTHYSDSCYRIWAKRTQKNQN